MLMSPDSNLCYRSGNLEVGYAQTKSGLEAPYIARLSGVGVVDGLSNLPTIKKNYQGNKYVTN